MSHQHIPQLKGVTITILLHLQKVKCEILIYSTEDHSYYLKTRHKYPSNSSTSLTTSALDLAINKRLYHHLLMLLHQHRCQQLLQSLLHPSILLELLNLNKSFPDDLMLEVVVSRLKYLP